DAVSGRERREGGIFLDKPTGVHIPLFILGFPDFFQTIHISHGCFEAGVGMHQIIEFFRDRAETPTRIIRRAAISPRTKHHRGYVAVEYAPSTPIKCANGGVYDFEDRLGMELIVRSESILKIIQ